MFESVGILPLSDRSILEEAGKNYSRVNNTFHNNWTEINDTSNIGIIDPIIILVTYNCIAVFGIFWNLLIIAVLLNYQKMKSLPNIYILNLAVADLMFLAALPFISLWHAYPNWMLGPAMCIIIMGFDGWNQFNSILFMVAMSIDRFCAVVIPFKSRSFRTTKNTYIICGCIWFASFFISLPIWLNTKLVVNGEKTMCSVGLPNFFGNYAFVLGFVIPLIVIAGCYGMILHRLVCIRGPDSNQSRSKTKKATFLVIIIVITFILLWLPFYIIQFFSGYPPTAIVVCLILSYSNSCINPLLYNIFGQNFRANTLKFLGWQKERKIWKRKRTSKRSFTSHTAVTSLRGKSTTTSSSANHSFEKECHSNGIEMKSNQKKP